MYYFGKSDIGKKRQTNQDTYHTARFCDNVTLFILCDGMGGTNGGNIASGLAVKTTCEYIENKVLEKTDFESDICNSSEIDFKTLLCEAVSAANSAVYKRAKDSKDLKNMGTTLVCALFVDEKLYIANVGDSRLYLIEKNKISALTHDHSYVQLLVDMGQITKEEAAVNPGRNILTRAVGTEASVETDVIELDAPKKGSYICLCSDGLYNFMSEDEMKNIIRKKNKEYDDDDFDSELSYKTNTLINLANANGGGDNITIILIKIV